MKITKISVAIFIASVGPSEAFTNPCKTAIGSSAYTSTINIHGNSKVAPQQSSSLFPRPRSSQKLAATAVLSPPEGSSSTSVNGGVLTFKTKYGYLNPFAIYSGLTAILWALPWYVALTLCQFMYKITNNKWDKMKRIPIFFSHIWGFLLLKLTNCTPEIEGLDLLEKFYKEGRAAMFVANHNSWLDIAFMAITLGWRNHKLIAKAELEKVPILGKAISIGGHVMVDRSSRKSQIMTLKSGMQWLKDGVHLCAFPEGTRSKTGRLLPFKNGAFKMAFKVGAPIVPISIVASGKAQPGDWIFPKMMCRGVCKVVVHEPIESTGKTEAELAALVRKAVIDGLPEDQHPLDEYVDDDE
mmetsp:Transcript_25577/g.37960  ORF Transcript_25577/g.37960 Transcript_25577/m.37960 type:complete len:355 (+) Transcript_25577:154-1218(+)